MTIKSFGKTPVRANKLAKSQIQNMEALLSATNPQSEVFRLNSSEKNEQEVSPVLSEVLGFSLDIATLTDGAFNPCLYPITKEWGFTTQNYKVPSKLLIEKLLLYTDYEKACVQAFKLTKADKMEFDFGGVGKGFAGDEAIKTLLQNGVTSAILDLGGNIQLLGSKPDGSDWTIGLRNPWEAGAQPVLSLKISDCAVITSGGYERFFTGDDGRRYIHIFDSKTGFPVDNGIASVTVICKEGRLGDALSTALFAMGKEKAVDFWKSNKAAFDFDMIIIFENKTILYTKGLSQKLSLLFDFTQVDKIDIEQK